MIPTKPSLASKKCITRKLVSVFQCQNLFYESQTVRLEVFHGWIRYFLQSISVGLGNYWRNRKNFVKQASKFYPLDIDYGQV